MPAFRKTVIALGSLAGGLLVAAANVSSPSYAATKTKIDYEHLINIAALQTVNSQKMSKEMILLAMGINKDANLKTIVASQNMFQRTIKGLRDGDVSLGLPRSNNPEVLAKLARVDEVWARYQTALNEGLKPGKVKRATVSVIADLSVPLFGAIKETVKAYQQEAAKHGLHSVLSVAIDTSSQQRVLTQKMSKEFLLIAYRLDVEKYRQSLAQSYKEFDTTLQSLMQGNLEIGLLPAPTGEIRAQLRKVQRLWDEFLPIMKAAADGSTISKEMIKRVDSMNMTLLKEINATVEMYEAL